MGIKLKISGGYLKRSNLIVSKSAKPTKSIIKQSIFNILGEDIKNKTIVDLFSGTGNLGFEAISRGAKYAILVEDDYNSFKTIQENIVNLNLSDKVEVQHIDSLKFIGNSPEAFDIVFADPPYNAPLRHFLKTAHIIIKQKGYLIYLHKSNEIDLNAKELDLIETRKFGKSSYTVYKRT